MFLPLLLEDFCAQEEGVEMREGVGIREVQPGVLVLEDGTQQHFDECLWCTQASAPSWLATTGLQTGLVQHPFRCCLSVCCVPALGSQCQCSCHAHKENSSTCSQRHKLCAHGKSATKQHSFGHVMDIRSCMDASIRLGRGHTDVSVPACH